MANSLGFLDKPNTTATQIGPQPKPATPTTVKSTFLDPSNPWRVGTSTPTTALTAKKSTTSKPRQSNASSAIPATGYNYTDANPAQPAARKVGTTLAPTAEEAARQHRSQLDAAAAAQQAAAKPGIQVVAARPGAYQPLVTQDQFNQIAQQYQRQAQGYRPPTATPNLPPNVQTDAQQPATPTGATPAAPTGEVWRASHAIDEAGNHLSYGWKVPGAITVPKNVDLQRSQVRQPWQIRYNQPAWTEIGMRYRMSDEVLAAETADRQRRAGQPIRPWASYTDAEKYYLRYGVMPQGEQATRPTTGDQAIAAADAQHGRLINDYRARNWDVRAGRPKWPGWGETGPVLSAPPPAQQLTQQALDRAAQQPGQAAAPATPAAAPTAWATPASPAQQAQIAANNQLLLQINPNAATTGLTTNDVNAVAREIIRRYMPNIDASTLTLADIGAIMALSYTPPPGMEQQYGYDTDWLSQLIPSE